MSVNSFFFFFFNDTATTEIYTLSLHDALPIYDRLLALEPAGTAVGLVAVVGLGLHLRLEARVLQLLFAEVRLRVLRRRVMLGVLVGHASSFASGGSRVRPRAVPRVPLWIIGTLIGAPPSWALGQPLRGLASTALLLHVTHVISGFLRVSTD